jgi:hypothetical protein
MKAVIILFLLMITGCTGSECNTLPLVAYDLNLTNKGAETWNCFTQSIHPDFTSEASFADSFAAGCHVTLDRGCGMTDLDILCQGFDINVKCNFDGLVGECTDTHTTETCHYTAVLVPR